MLDEYGYGQRGRHPRGGIFVKINLTKLCELCRKLWGPRKSDIGERIEQAKRDDAEWEMLWSKPSGDRK